MDNKEKAREIALAYKLRSYCAPNEREEIAMTMAEWKDQQFKEYLEKKLKEIDKDRYALIDYADALVNLCKEVLLEEIINDFFGEDTYPQND